MKSYSFHSFLLSHWHNALFPQQSKKKVNTSIKVCVIPNDLKREKKILKRRKENPQELRSSHQVLTLGPKTSFSC